jgi:hypothetical protein
MTGEDTVHFQVLLLSTGSFPHLLKTALLSYNSHSRKQSLLKYTVQWFSVYLQTDTTIPTINFRTYSLPHKRTPAQAGYRWLTPVIPATQEAEIRRIKVRSQSRQIVQETLS